MQKCETDLEREIWTVSSGSERADQQTESVQPMPTTPQQTLASPTTREAEI